MSQEDDELDKAFRSSIEKMRLVPPPTVWDGVRAAALQQQLFRYQTMNGWLKLLSAVLAVALVGSIYFSSRKNESVVEKNTVYITKTDTVFINKNENILLPSEQPIVARKNVHEKEILRTNLAENVVKKPDKQVISKEQTNNSTTYTTKKYTENSPISTNKKPINAVRNEEKLVAKTDKLEGNASVEESKNINHEITQQGVSQSYGKDITIRNNSVINKNEIAKKFDFGNTISERKLLGRNIKESNLTVNFPTVNYAFRTRPSFRKPKGSVLVLSKLSLSTYYSLDANTLTQKQTTSAGQVVLQNSLNGHGYGFRVGYEINPKWIILAGLEKSSASFTETEDKDDHNLVGTEIHGDKPVYSHPTSLGTSYIPNDDKNNDKVNLRINGEHYISLVRIPVAAKYTFYDRNKNMLGINNKSLKLYALGGMDWIFSIKQHLPFEVTNPTNGKKKEVVVTNFQGVQKNSFGIRLGVGAEYNFWKNFHLYLEPIYKNNITSIVKETNHVTKIAGFSITTGLRYQFGK